jgi:hypothetical protein
VFTQVFVANPNKPRPIIDTLLENRRELLKLLHNLPTSKGTVAHECLFPHIEPLVPEGTVVPEHCNVEERCHAWKYCKIADFAPLCR